MSWQAIKSCVKCNKVLSDNQVMYSLGVCPYCGNAEGCTIVKTNKRAARWIRTNSKWQFWKNVGHWEYKDEMK